MTAQIGDKYHYKGKKSTIVAMSEPINFQPQKYGLQPVAACTACWRGYWCEYEISESGMVLKNLFINTGDDKYPAINGIKAESGKDLVEYFGHKLYKDLNIGIEYSGKIVVGNDFINKYYIHMGFQRAWSYKELNEFVFENGILMNIIDHSQMAEKIRCEIDKLGTDLTEINGIVNFVEESFSLEYKDKCWWID